MTPYKATGGIKESAANARAFVKEHKDIFWKVFKPLIPFIAILIGIDVAIAYFQFTENPDSENIGDFAIGELIASYFFTCLVISWHRVVLDGPDRYEPMNPFKPKSSDWAFIGMGILVFLIAFMIPLTAGLIAGFAAGVTGASWLFVLIIPAVFVAIYVTFKFLFYFPSKATGNNITLKQSYRMTKGYIWKIIAANFLAAWRITLVMFAYIFLAFTSIMFLAGAAGVAGAGEGMIGNIAFMLGVAMMLPVTFYFQPLLTVIGVTVLSNFYQHALQNGPNPASSSAPQPQAVEDNAPEETEKENPLGTDGSVQQDMNKARKALDKDN